MARVRRIKYSENNVNRLIVLPEPRECRKLRARKIFHGVIMGILVLIPSLFFLLMLIPPEAPTIEEDGVKLTAHYDDARGVTNCLVELTYDGNLRSSRVTAAFYGADGSLYEQRTLTCFSHESRARTVHVECEVEGEITSCRVVEQGEIDVGAYAEGIVIVLIVLLAGIYLFLFAPFWIRIFGESCKEYLYRGMHILVYAGHFHYYIKVNGEKYDETVRIYPALLFWNPLFWLVFRTIPLSCRLSSGDRMTVTVSPFCKRIRVKINDRLRTPL